MTVIANEVGCVPNTVARVLKQLEEQGLVKQVQIKGSNNRAWVRVVNVYETEGLINELGCACVGNDTQARSSRLQYIRNKGQERINGSSVL